MLSAIGYTVGVPIRRISTIIGLGVYDGSRQSVELAMARMSSRGMHSLPEDDDQEEKGERACEEAASSDDVAARKRKTWGHVGNRCAIMQRLFRQSIKVRRRSPSI